MSHEVHFIKTIAEGARSAVADLPPPSSKKSPVIAGILGFLFGAFGVGIYLGRWSDFFMCLGIQIALACIPVPPLDLLLAWVAGAVYGAYRASQS